MTRRLIIEGIRRAEGRADICHTPYLRTSVAQGRFLGGPGRRAEAHTRPAVPKMPQVLRAGLIAERARL